MEQIQIVEIIQTVHVQTQNIKKQIWDGEMFVSMTLHRHKGIPSTAQMDWLIATYGQPGTYREGRFWNYSRSGDFTLMDEKVYMWYQIKWNKQ